MGGEHAEIGSEDVFPTAVTDVVYALTECFRRRYGADDPQSIHEILRIVRHLLHGFELGLSLCQQSDVAQCNVSVFDLWFTAFALIHRKAVQLLDQFTLPQQPAHNGQTTRRYDTLVSGYMIPRFAISCCCFFTPVGCDACAVLEAGKAPGGCEFG